MYSLLWQHIHRLLYLHVKNANIISIDEHQNIRYIGDSYAFSVNEILRNMFGCYTRSAKVEKLIDEFKKKMDRDEYALVKNLLENLAELHGEEHPKVIALKLEYRMEAE